MRQRWETWVRLVFALVAAVFAATTPRVVEAAYWTVPVDYYKLEHIRFALSQDQYGGGVIFNLTQQPALQAGLLDGAATKVSASFDSERGYAASFTAASASRIIYRAPLVSEAANQDAASLSFWLKPRDAADAMVLSGGDLNAGYSLYVYLGRLRLVVWGQGGSQPGMYQIVDGRSEMTPGVWRNVVLTQTAKAAPSGAYLAIYVDGVLEGAAMASPDGSGLLGRTTTEASRAVIGGASESGWIYERVGERWRYERDQDKTGKIDRIEAFTNADIAEFRYFGGLQFVCSDKTRSDYRSRNIAAKIGDRCDVASDVASFAHDRVEQAGFLARLPFAHDLSDRNFQGLNTANAVSACPSCSAPPFTYDPLRGSVASFASNRVQYRTDVGALSVAKVGWPYSIAFWLEIPPAQNDFQPIVTGGGSRRAGFDIGLGALGRVSATAWAFGGAKLASVSSSSLTPGWHHVAVSFDGLPSRRSALEAPSSLKLYIDGEGQASRPLDAPMPPETPAPVTIGGADPANGTLDPAARSLYGATFKGRLSEMQILSMPLTYAQARGLASRFPNAYTPNIARQDYPFAWRPAEGVPPQDGYTYRNPVASADNGHTDAANTYDSLNLDFAVDWSRSAPRWIDDSTGQASRNCEYVLGGVKYFHALKDAQVDEPASVLLCFSPQKIDHNMPPFSLALYYPAYGKYLFTTLVEPMATQPVLQKLKTYSSAHAVDGLKTQIGLNIGRYNMVVQARTEDASVSPAPNYISPVYQGASDLISKAFQYSSAGPRPEQQVTAVYPAASVSGVKPSFVDQKQLLDNLDMKFAKDR